MHAFAEEMILGNNDKFCLVRSPVFITNCWRDGYLHPYSRTCVTYKVLLLHNYNKRYEDLTNKDKIVFISNVMEQTKELDLYYLYTFSDSVVGYDINYNFGTTYCFVRGARKPIKEQTYEDFEREKKMIEEDKKIAEYRAYKEKKERAEKEEDLEADKQLYEKLKERFEGK